MNNPLHAPYHADRCVHQTVSILENELVARDTYRLRIESPLIAKSIYPGQFLMLRLSGVSDPLIGRPLAVFDVIAGSQGNPSFIDVVYVAKGKFTTQLSQSWLGRKLDVWGPLGNGFSTEPCERLIMVAGGIGFTPFWALAREGLGRAQFGAPPRSGRFADRVSFCYGARSASYLISREDFQRLGVDVQIATDDGSLGHPGLVTELLTELLGRALVQNTETVRIACCGPEPMMAAVSRIADAFRVPCEVSLETPMACGVGICFTCVAQVRVGEDGWDYKRTCVEGPVFDSKRIVW